MNLFKTKFDAATIVLIPACIGINYLGKMFASLLKLPLWLDSIGTCFGGCLGGLIIGGICYASLGDLYAAKRLLKYPLPHGGWPWVQQILGVCFF